MAGVIVLLLLASQVGPAGAQQPPPPPPIPPPRIAPETPQPGDVLWTFAHEPPLFDQRFAEAIATLIDARERPLGRHVFYAEVRAGTGILAFRSQAPAPMSQAPLLLTAAGFPPPLSQVHEAGRCKVWAAPAPTGVSSTDTASAAATGLAAFFQSALADVGVSIQPCTTTANVSDADILVWVQGGPPPAIPERRDSTFLTWPGSVPSQSGPSLVSPPRTGDGGMAADH